MFSVSAKRLRHFGSQAEVHQETSRRRRFAPHRAKLWALALRAAGNHATTNRRFECQATASQKQKHFPYSISEADHGKTTRLGRSSRPLWGSDGAGYQRARPRSGATANASSVKGETSPLRAGTTGLSNPSLTIPLTHRKESISWTIQPTSTCFSTMAT